MQDLARKFDKTVIFSKSLRTRSHGRAELRTNNVGAEGKTSLGCFRVVLDLPWLDGSLVPKKNM
jgi:hypothetical protein